MRWAFESSWPLLVGAVVVLAAAGWLSWAQWTRRKREKAVAWTEGIRLCAVALLVFTLFRPELIREIPRTDPPEVAILWDASNSMQTRDLQPNGETPQTRAEWLKKELEAQFWKPLEQQGAVSVAPFSSPPPPDSAEEQGTNLAAALDSALQGRPNLKAVLLLTDGDWNLGNSPISAATAYAAQNIPIYAVGIGSDKALPDLELSPIAAPAFGLLGEQISLPFQVQSTMPEALRTEVRLESENGVLLRKPIEIPPFGVVREAFVWAPSEPGDYTLKVSLPVEKTEALTNNNTQELRISVRNETLKVLVIDSTPRWEYRFLRNALVRDPGVEVNTLLLHPGMKPGGGTDYLERFPETKELLSRYDVVFLGDVGNGPGELTNSQLELLKGLVESQGSGLVLLPGLRGRLTELEKSPIGEMFPVELDSANAQGTGRATESHLTLTGEGAGHLLTRLANDESSNALLWRNLPGFYWSAPVKKSRPGSTVLAVHESHRNEFGRIPLLVTREFGNGKVLFLGTDGAWRWRKGVEDRYHYRFWAQVVRWMAHQRKLAGNEGIRLSFSPENPRQGENVALLATVLDANGFPIEKGRVTADLKAPSGKTERIEFTPQEGGWGVFRSGFRPLESGVYQLKVTGPNRTLETELLVSAINRERLGQPANLPVLQEIATLTNGSFGTVEQLAKVVEQITLLPEPKPQEQRFQLWSSPWWGGLILTLLAAFWVGRKVLGMV